MTSIARNGITETETANGFANRFIWLMVKRSKVLPFGGEWQEVDTAPLVTGLREALAFAKSAGEISWDDEAKRLWREVYTELSEGKPGLFGAVVGRAEAQTLRLASVYAVMDQSPTIRLPHLRAALALWRYAEDSARYIFGDATGDPIADRIDTALKEAGEEGLSRTNISHLFNRHETAGRIASALSLLANTGRARRRSEETGGRKAERWFST